MARRERKLIERWSRRFLKAVVTPHVTAHAVALGTAIGVFVAFTPTMGVQMLLAAVIATALGVSRAAAVLGVWISNPLTIVPIYGFAYWAGWLVVGGPTTREFIDRLRAALGEMDSAGTLAFVERFNSLLALGAETLWPLTVGGVAVGALAGAICYGMVRLMIHWYPHHPRRKSKSRRPEAARHAA